jgi:hypothetical protein
MIAAVRSARTKIKKPAVKTAITAAAGTLT